MANAIALAANPAGTGWSSHPPSIPRTTSISNANANDARPQSSGPRVVFPLPGVPLSNIRRAMHPTIGDTRRRRHRPAILPPHPRIRPHRPRCLRRGQLSSSVVGRATSAVIRASMSSRASAKRASCCTAAFFRWLATAQSQTGLVAGAAGGSAVSMVTASTGRDLWPGSPVARWRAGWAAACRLIARTGSGRPSWPWWNVAPGRTNATSCGAFTARHRC